MPRRGTVLQTGRGIVTSLPALNGALQMTKHTATSVSDLMCGISAQLNVSVRIVQTAETAEDFERYRMAVGIVMAAMYEHALAPLYREHPDLEPESMKV